jgi:hypothetical protein
MLRRFQVSFAFVVCLLTLPAQAQEPVDQRPTNEPPAAPPPTTAKPDGKPVADQNGGWHTELHGYFRAPMTMGLSSRPGPDNMTGPSRTQITYAPNRTIDSSYYSFAYTRLQEQDWAEVFVHLKKKHVDAAVGWMGYWFQGVGFRNYDAAWAPGLAYVALDTDFDAFGLTPNFAFTMGAWWPKFGYFEKYDTYTLGRFRQLGEQLKLTVPLSRDLTLELVHGVGTSRDGSFNTGAPAFYGAVVGLDLVTYGNVALSYQKSFDVGLHYNQQSTSDPNLWPTSMVAAKSFGTVREAHLATIGAEANLRLPYVGHLWISPSLISVLNGWALSSGGTEVMHSLGGNGVSSNFMAFAGSPENSTGSGSMFNLGFLYENSLRSIQGQAPGGVGDLTFSVFGLLASASRDLPSTTTLTQTSSKQFKYGADLTFQALPWLSVMLRYDGVNYDVGNKVTALPGPDGTGGGTGGYSFSSITPRVTVSSHFLSSERIYLQYSRYTYGDKMVLNASWPWGSSLVAGASVLQAGPYSGMTPDANVVKLQADIAF